MYYLLCLCKLLNRLIHAGRGKTGYNSNGHSSNVVPRREIRHSERQSHSAERAAHHAADDRNPLIINI